jgi:hypothetical protein
MEKRRVAPRMYFESLEKRKPSYHCRESINDPTVFWLEA